MIDLFATLATHIRDLFQKQQGHDPGKLLGHNLNTFKQIAKNFDGIQQGFYVIGGYTSMGKTTLMVNLLNDALKSGVPCLYASLDDNWDIILNRLVSIMTVIPFNRVKKQLAGVELEQAVTAWNSLEGWAESGLLKLYDISHINGLQDLKHML